MPVGPLKAQHCTEINIERSMSAASAVADLLAMMNARLAFAEAYNRAVLPPIERLASQGQVKARQVRRDSHGRRSKIARICTVCGTTETPSWRRGGDGVRTLCNACGLRFLRECRKKERNDGALAPVHLHVRPFAHPIPPAKRSMSARSSSALDTR